MSRSAPRLIAFCAGHAASAGAFLLVGACTLGPDWDKPTTSGPATFPPPEGDPAQSQAVATAPDPAWWDIYGDAELSALERKVAAANLDVAEASTRVLQSRAERQVVGADQYPTFDANASYARERASPNGVLGLLGTTPGQSSATIANGSPGFGPASLPGTAGSPAFNLPQYGFDASWELDIWGRVSRAVEAADAAADASAEMRRGVLLSVLAETARDYLQLRGVQAQITITTQNVDNAAHSLALTRLRFADGVATNLDVANAAAQLAEIRASLPVQRKQEAQLVNALSFLVGAPPRTLSAELGPPKPIPPVPAAVPIGLPSELAERRPDIREAEARLHEATADIGIAVADFYPRITLSGSLDIQALQTSGLGSWNSRQYAFGPSISLPLFEGGRLRGTLELRKVEQKEAAIDYQRIVLKAWHEVDDALTEYNALQNQRDQLDEAVQQNKTALETAQSQYGQGAVDFLTVLTVQNQLLTTQRALVQASADTDVALAGLYKALGGGWQQDFPVQKTAQTEEAAALASSEPTLSATATVPLQPSQAER